MFSAMCERCGGRLEAPRAWGPGGSLLCVPCAQRRENRDAVRAYLAGRFAGAPVEPISLEPRPVVRRCHRCARPADRDDAGARYSLRWFCDRCRRPVLRVCLRCSLPIVPGQSSAEDGPDLVHAQCRDLVEELREIVRREGDAREGNATDEEPSPLPLAELAEAADGEDLDAQRRRVVEAIAAARVRAATRPAEGS